jgi:formamidopyrimidine-DNA glycosylase
VFELPECANLVKQMNETILGKTVSRGQLGNSPHKFVWYNRKHDEFERLTKGKRVGKAYARGRWMFVPLEPGYVIVIGEWGGRLLYHPVGSCNHQGTKTPGGRKDPKEDGPALPEKYHALIEFEDGSALSAKTQMWGAFELFEQGRELEREYIKDMRPTPADRSFTFGYFTKLVDEVRSGEKRSAKGLLVQEQLIPGLGNSIAQDILLRAGLSPKHPVDGLGKPELRRLYDAILATVREVTAKRGRSDEFDLFGRPGGYQRVMDSAAVGKPCPNCGTKVQKTAYLGGACYLCPRCQS